MGLASGKTQQDMANLNRSCSGQWCGGAGTAEHCCTRAEHWASTAAGLLVAELSGGCAQHCVWCMDIPDISNVSNNCCEMSPFALKSLQFYVTAAALVPS